MKDLFKAISKAHILLVVFLILMVGSAIFALQYRDGSNEDTDAPVIIIVGDNPQELEIGDRYIELGAAAVDDLDGDISAKIVIDASAVDTTKVGRYKVIYGVLDSAGNVGESKTRIVNIKNVGILDQNTLNSKRR